MKRYLSRIFQIHFIILIFLKGYFLFVLVNVGPHRSEKFKSLHVSFTLLILVQCHCGILPIYAFTYVSFLPEILFLTENMSDF